MSYLAQYTAAPAAEKHRLVQNWIKESPLDFFDELLRERPVFRTPEITLLTKFHDVVEALSLPEIFSVRFYAPKMGSFMLAQDDTASHYRDKAVMQAVMNRDDAPRVRKIVAELADQALDDNPTRIEAVSQLARKIPARIVRRYFGFEGPDLDTMLRWSRAAQLDNFHNHPFHHLENSERIHAEADAAKLEMQQYLQEYIPRRLRELQQEPDRDDILSRLLKTRFPDSVQFGLDRVGVNTIGMLIGAVETASQAIVQVLDELYRRPLQIEEARAAAEASRDAVFDLYVWESLRFHPISPFMYRYCERDYTIAKGSARQTTIPAGTTVWLATLAAMFDPDEVPLPHEFQIQRPPHIRLHFGYGLHRCLGEHVGAMLIPETVKRVLLRRDIRPAPGPEGEIDYRGGPFPERYVLTCGPGGLPGGFGQNADP